MNQNEVLELLKRAKRQNDMVAILPGSDTSKVLIKVLEESTWIPVDDEKKLPESGKYILLSFENFSLPMVGRYEGNKEDGGVFYVGDDTESCLTHELFVNAWMPLPDPYIADSENVHTEKPQTNADRIRSMTDEELAIYMMCPNEMGLAEIECDKTDSCNCYECLLNWLRAESEE